MAICKRCGKKVLFSFSLIDGLCSNCFAEQQKEQQQLEQQQLDFAHQYFGQVVELYQSAHISIKSVSSVSEIKQAKECCERCIDLLKNISTIPQMDSVLVESLSPPSHILSRVHLDGLGQIDLDSENKSIVLDRPYRELQSLVNSYNLILENTAEFESLLSSISRVSVNIISQEPFSRESLQYPILKTRNITARTPLSSLNSFIVLDTETTGLSPIRDEIIQISAIHFVGFSPAKVFSTYVKPRNGLNPAAARVNHITVEQVDCAPYFEEICHALKDFLGSDTPIVGHNVSFDCNFLFSSGIDYQHIYNRKIFDTMDLAKREFPHQQSYSLDALCRHELNIVRTDAHDSISDALATGLLFKKICKQRMTF